MAPDFRSCSGECSQSRFPIHDAESYCTSYELHGGEDKARSDEAAGNLVIYRSAHAIPGASHRLVHTTHRYRAKCAVRSGCCILGTISDPSLRLCRGSIRRPDAVSLVAPPFRSSKTTEGLKVGSVYTVIAVPNTVRVSFDPLVRFLLADSGDSNSR